jgi:hypothetical protein
VRGYKTKADLAERAAKEKQFLADMQAAHGKYTNAEIEQQKQRTKEAENAAKGITVTWQGALKQMSDAWVALGQVTGGVMGKIASSVGQGIVSIQGMTDQLKTAKASFTSGGGFSSIMSGLSGVASAASMAINLGMQLWKAFSKSPEQKVAEETVRDFGVNISTELAKKIADASKRFKAVGGGRTSAELLALGDIIGEAGGLSPKNVDKLALRLHDMFSEFDRGIFSTKDLTEALGKSLPAFAEFATKNSKGMTAVGDAVQLLVARVKDGKLTTEDAAKTLDQTFGLITKDALDNNKILNQSFFEIAKSAKDAGIEVKSLADFQDKMNSKLASGLKAAVSVLPDLKQSTDEMKRSIAVGPEVVGQWQGSFDRLSRIALASYNSMIASGKTAVEAILAVGDSVDILSARQEALGLQSNESFETLKRFSELVKGNQELVESVGGLNDVMVALANTGSLNEQTFRDLQAEGVSTFDRLREAGFSQQEAEAQMKPLLESIIKLHEERGMAVDEETQKLIDQAEQDGILREQQQTTQEVLKEGLGEIITLLGGELPKAWQAAAKAGVTAMATTKGATDNVNGAVKGVQGSLDSTDWQGWANDAVNAAQTAESAIDSVSFGSSPGGIKEIPIQLDKAVRAFSQFEYAGVAAAESVQESIDAMHAGETGMAIAAAGGVGIAAGARGGAGGVTLNITIEGPTFWDDPNSVRPIVRAVGDALMERLRANKQLGL